MLTIRLQRIGKKHEPHFRLVAADSRRHVSKNSIKVLGNFNPRTKELNYDEKSILELLGFGAQVSNRVARLLEKKIKHKTLKPINHPEKKARKSVKAKPDKTDQSSVEEASDKPKSEVTDSKTAETATASTEVATAI
ncbi:MAG: 30S ribosomal protein S16 [Patescibacteria group bacterium]